MSITNLYNNEIYPLNNISFLGKVYIDQLRIVNRGDNTEVYLSSDEDGKLLVDDNDPIGGDSDIDVRPPVIDTINLANPWRLTTKYLVLTNRKDDTQSLLSVNSDGNLVVNDDELVVTETADFNGDNGIVVHPYNCSLNGLFTVSQICLFNDDGKEIVITVDDGELSFNGGILGSAPVNTVLPAVTGTDLVGSTLTSTDGTWDGSPVPDYTVEWYRYDDDEGTNPVLISGATNHTYVLQSADNGKYVRSNILATNVIDAVDAYSNYTSQVKTPVVNTVAPAITGSEVDGEILTCSAGTYTGNVVGLTYQWYRANADHSSPVAISGETGTTHVLSSSDIGKTLKCVVTCNGFYGSQVVTDSNWTGTISAATQFDDLVASLAPYVWYPGTNATDHGSAAHNLTSFNSLVAGSLLSSGTAYNGSFDFSNNSFNQTDQNVNYQDTNFVMHLIYRPSAADIADGPWIVSSCIGSGGDTNLVLYVYPNNAGHNTIGAYLGGGIQFQPVTIDAVAGTDLQIILEISGGSNPRVVTLTLNDGTSAHTYTDNKNWGSGTKTLSLGKQPGAGVQTTGKIQHLFWRNSALTTQERNDLVQAFIDHN